MEQNKEIFQYLSKTKPDAEAEIFGGTEFPNIRGKVNFFSLPAGVIVVADIENLPRTETNIFALHIHEGNSCENNFEKTGGHYNPQNLPHPQHAGDLPPFFSSNKGAWQAVFTDRFRVEEVLGRVVVIHQNPDDFTSQPAGNSGTKIACGRIEKV